MSNEDDFPALPVAGKVFEDELGRRIEQTTYGQILNPGDELLRKKDVEALIQDKIEKYDRPTTDPYVQQSIVDKLEELLDEVQNNE